MLKKTRILSAAVLSVSMLLTAGGLTAVNAEEMAVITIEGETQPSYDSSYMAWSADSAGTALTGYLSGDKYGNIRTGSGSEFDSDKAVFGYSFEVTAAGNYSLTFTASKYNNTTYSSYAIAIDDGAFVTVENGTTVTKTADIIGSGSDSTFAVYKVNEDYALSAGSHTLKFKMLDTGSRTDGRGYVFVDCMTFAQTSSFDSIVISGSDGKTVSDSSVIQTTEATETGGTAYPVFKTSSGVQCPDDGVVVTYSVNAEYDGLYNMTVSANQYNGSLSTYAVAVNDSAFTTINASSVVSTEQVNTLIYKYGTNLYYQLRKGANTVSFKILTGRTSDSRVYCFLNYIQLDRVSRNVNVADGNEVLVYGLEPHTYNHTDIYAESTEVEGGLTIKTAAGSVFPEDGVAITYNIIAPAAGIYKLTAAASPHSGSWSGYAVAVNGGAYTEINTDNAGSSSNPNGGWSASNSNHYIGIYNTTALFSLNEGSNTISFKLTDARTDNTSGRGFAVLEYLKLTPAAVTPASASITSFNKITEDTDEATAVIFGVSPEEIDGAAAVIDSVSVTINGRTITKDSTVINGEAVFGIVVNKHIEQSDINIAVNGASVAVD